MRRNKTNDRTRTYRQLRHTKAGCRRGMHNQRTLVASFGEFLDVPCAYLRFGANPPYDAAASEAQRRGWPDRDLGGAHFHMLVDPVAVADALLAITSAS